MSNHTNTARTDPAYVAVPEGGTGPGVVVLHAWWGLNPFFKQLCERLAAEGFVAAAPDLFNGKTATTIKEAQQLRDKLKRSTASKHILQAATQVHDLTGTTSSLGVIGFSLGGHYALWLTEQPSVPVSATAIFYGMRGSDYTATRSAFLGHFAEHDEYVARSGVKKLENALRSARREVTFHTYPGTAHWFFEADRPEYNAEAAQLAWERTLLFLRERLAS